MRSTSWGRLVRLDGGVKTEKKSGKVALTGGGACAYVLGDNCSLKGYLNMKRGYMVVWDLGMPVHAPAM